MNKVYQRILSLEQVLKRKSLFLFGPRQTGKSTWLKLHYPDALYINLLSKKVFDDYSTRNNALESDLMLWSKKKGPAKGQNAMNIVIIDEVQKLPGLLDEVHHQIEQDKTLRFILTGSSARKLKRGGTNLLGGRASVKYLFPLAFPEIKEDLKTLAGMEQRLLRGGLPSIYNSEAPVEDLQDYIQLYLNEEIKAEGLIRNYESFNRFLLTSGLVNTQQINFTQVGNDAQVPARTIHDYFQILEDTLIGKMLPAFTQTTSRKAMTSAKFYLFDTGVANALLGRLSLAAGTPEFGALFEQFVVLEVLAFTSYFNKNVQISYWRSTTKFEVDLIISERGSTTTTVGKQKPLLAIEIKGKAKVMEKDLKGLMAFAEDFPKCKKLVVVTEGRPFIERNGVEIMPVFAFLEKLWGEELF